MKRGSSNEGIGQCALCRKPFAVGDGSREHIIPNAIGGRKKVAGFLCRDCNSRTGQEWDSELARQLNPVSNLLGIKRERGSPPTMVVETLAGRRLRHESGGRMTRHRVEISVEEIDGELRVSGSAPSTKELKKHLRRQARRDPRLKGVDLMSHAVATREYEPSPMHIELGFGDVAAGRSVVKSCVALAHLVGVRLDDLEQAREFLRGKDAPCFGYYNETDVVSDRPGGVFFHCVHVQGNARTGMVVGYVEYFGYMRIVVGLSDAYRGSGFAETYAVDPVAGTDLEISVNLPDFTAQDIEDIYEYKKVDFEVCGKAIEPLIESYQGTARKREIGRIVDEAFDYAGEECGVQLGDEIPEEQRTRFGHLVAERLTKGLTEFALHQMEPPDFENIEQMFKADKEDRAKG